MPRSSTVSIRQRFAIDLVPEGLPFQQFHGDEGSPIGLIDFVDGADVRVVQRGRSLGLPPKTAESLGVVGEFVGKELEGDVATELEVLSLVHHAHAPTPDPAEDAVIGNRLILRFGGVDTNRMVSARPRKVNIRGHSLCEAEILHELTLFTGTSEMWHADFAVHRYVADAKILDVSSAIRKLSRGGYSGIRSDPPNEMTPWLGL
jgi:hypothetical protein